MWAIFNNRLFWSEILRYMVLVLFIRSITVEAISIEGSTTSRYTSAEAETEVYRFFSTTQSSITAVVTAVMIFLGRLKTAVTTSDVFPRPMAITRIVLNKTFVIIITWVSPVLLQCIEINLSTAQLRGTSDCSPPVKGTIVIIDNLPGIANYYSFDRLHRNAILTGSKTLTI